MVPPLSTDISYTYISGSSYASFEFFSAVCLCYVSNINTQTKQRRQGRKCLSGLQQAQLASYAALQLVLLLCVVCFIQCYHMQAQEARNTFINPNSVSTSDVTQFCVHGRSAWKYCPSTR